ncbi:MAG: DUF2169 domain-containing protein, partial [Desulfococcaceae bacterium]|nr:DUF2169 domain-containing protein [Desulfococcaceae bacterium]
KSLHSGLLYKTFSYMGKDYFSVSTIWGFELADGSPVLEQDIWSVIGEMLGKNEMFDGGMPKSNAEVLVYGNFYFPDGQTGTSGNVSLSIASVKKELTVFGNRFWIKKMGAEFGTTAPEPFSELPLTYNYAFGGEGYNPNPAGKGYKSIETEDGELHPLPNIEYPDHLIFSAKDRPQPAAFSRIDMMWEQRFAKSGTYDKKYIEERMPGLPDDIDWSYFNEAAEDQQIEGFFQGNEYFEIHNMHPEHPVIQGYLPGIYGRCFVSQEIDEQPVFREIETQLDTVWLFPNKNVGIVIHRGMTAVAEDDGSDITDLLIAHENLSDVPRPPEHYQNELIKRKDPQEGFKYLMNSTPLIPQGCQCGFKTIQEKNDFPLEFINRKNTEVYAEKQQKEAEDKISEQMEIIEKQIEEGVENKETLDTLNKLKQAQQKEPEELPEVKKINELIENIAPGILSDPKNLDISKLNLKGMDDLKAYNEKLAAEKQAEADNIMKEELKKLKEIQETAQKENPEIAEAMAQIEDILAESEHVPPLPRINITQYIEEMEKQFHEQLAPQMMQLRSQGISDELLADMNFDFDEIRKQIEDAAVKFKEGYRIGAHYTEEMSSPHNGKEPEILSGLLKAYQNGEKTADGDYAYLDFSGLDLSNIDLSNSFLEYADFTNCNLSGANLENAILAKATFVNTKLDNVNLKGANLGASLMDSAEFADSDLSGAILGKAKIRNTKFHNCKLLDRMEMFLESEFENADFTGSDLKKNNFIDADISGCCFAECDLTECNFLNPKMEGAVFDRAVLRSVNFIKAEGRNCSFIETSMKNVRFVGGCDLSDSVFTAAGADEANFRDCQLDNADFTEAFLHKSDFGGSGLVRAKFIRAEAVQAQFSKANLVYADLHRINLMEGSMLKTRLSGAKLTQTNLYSVSFIGSIIGEEGIEDAVFTDAYM